MRRIEDQVSGKLSRVALVVIFLLISAFLSANPLNDRKENAGSDSPFKMDKGSYIVAGVFRYFENAVRYSDFLFSHGISSRYGYYPGKGWYYVFIGYANQRDEAKSACLRHRRTRLLSEAWVLTIIDDYESHETRDIARGDTRTEKTPGESHFLPADIDHQATPVVQSAREDQPAASTQEEPMSPGKTNIMFYFRAYNARTHEPVDAAIDVIDPVQLKELAKFEANTLSVFEKPTGTNSLLTISDRFGYRKMEHQIDLNNIAGSSPSLSLSGDTVFIDFELSRLKTGDIVTMYNVYFFNNAAVMKPESRYEVNQLLEMLQENENYQIVIHGHTNGNGYGPIIKMQDRDVNFFALSSDNKEGKGSARQLSLERASAIQRYLAHQGITMKRMKVKGWGGKKMLYQANDPKAKQNVRVEVEIKSE